MSRRSILLATTICAAFAFAASTDLALAHGGGGGGGGFGGHSFGGAVHSAMPMASPAHNLGAVAHGANFAPTVSKPLPHKVPSGAAVNLAHSILTKPAIPPAVNQPPQVATKSVPPTPVKVGTIVDKPTIPSVGYGVGPGAIAAKPAIPQVGTQSVPSTPIKLGTIIDKPAIPKVALPPVPVPPPAPPVPPVPGTGGTGTSSTQTMHPMPKPSVGLGGVVIEGPVVDEVGVVALDTSCYWTKRKFLTDDGEVVRRVKVCETVDLDQP